MQGVERGRWSGHTGRRKRGEELIAKLRERREEFCTRQTFLRWNSLTMPYDA